MVECTNKEQVKSICENTYGAEHISLISALETIPDAVYICSADFKIIYMNPAMTDMIGVDKIGTLCHKAIYKSDTKCSWCVLDCIIKGPVQYEVRNHLNKHYYCVSNSCLFHEEDSIFKLTFFRDITQIKNTEQKVLIEKNLQSLGILAGGIAHDFNNLLAGVLGTIEIALMKIKPEEERVKYLKRINQASTLTRELTNQLIAFSKDVKPVKETVYINDLFKDAIDLSLNGSNIKLKFSIPDDTWFVNIDKSQIKLVINNILTNAMEAMDKKGQLQVYCKNMGISEKNILSLDKGQYVRIDIRDEGCGISEQDINKVFDPYFSTKERSNNKGQGLSLAICYSIIKRHDGAITAYSDLKEGATFSVYLPAVEPGPVTEAVSKKSLESKGKILVMDEEESIRNLSIMQLSRLGYTSKACIDGAAAIKLYKNEMESGYPFDVVILDLIHNSGMGGVDAIKELLKINPDVKGIVSTGYDRHPAGINFKAYGFSGVLIKPYTMVELENILSEFIVGD